VPANPYLQRILNARVYDVADETPLDVAPLLSARLGAKVLLKREDLQPVFSFKLRGAYNKMVNLPAAALRRGVIAASAGNHAQGVALAARKLGTRAVIVMPVTTPELKVEAVRALGAEVALHGDSYSDAYARAIVWQRQRRLTFVHPFDDPDVIAGQGTVGMEILRQHHPQEHGPLHAIFVAIGGGGLISGVAAYVKAVRPEIKIIGVQTVDSDAMARSLAAGRRITLREVGLFSDGTAVRQVGRETFRLCRRYVDDIVIVDNDALCAAIKDVFQDTRSILEPAGALGVAGAKAYAARTSLEGKTVAAVTCGANMNFDRLRFVAEFNYRISDSAAARVFVGVQLGRPGEARALIRSFEKAGFPTLDLTDDELAKLHLRHLVGGRSALAQDEHLYRFEFPERPGALMRFLASMSPNWNISLFHYRNQGADPGRVLVGLQVPPRDRPALRRFLADLGYRHWDETDNPAYQLFLR
jgi:threonine dehydratase